MRRLRQRDLEASRSYLRELYAQRDLEDFKRHVLATIGSVVPSESVIYVDPSVSVAVDDQGGELTPGSRNRHSPP